jgi:hypothetical protein
MSLTVSAELLAAAEAGQLDDAGFLACVRDSLPCAYDLVGELAGRLPDAEQAGQSFVDNQTAPGDAAQGQLLRAMASTSIRSALERHFGVRIAFQNCHRVAVFPLAAEGTDAYREFVSPRAHVLNQSPDLVNC